MSSRPSVPRARAGELVARPLGGGAESECLAFDMCGETQRGWVVSVRFQHHASRREAAQRVSVDGILTGKFLAVTAGWTVQVGQHEPLQLVPDLSFLRYVAHGLFGHDHRVLHTA